MKIKFTKPHFVGTRSFAKGEPADLPDDQAVALVTANVAVPVKDEPPLTTAVDKTEPTERATAKA